MVSIILCLNFVNYFNQFGEEYECLYISDAGRVKQHLHELYGHLGHEEYVYGERNHESEKSSGKIDNIYLRAAENLS